MNKNIPKQLAGAGVSPGIAIGAATVVKWHLPEVPHRVISQEDVPGEIERLRNAIQSVKGYLETLRERAEEEAGEEEAKIFEAQIMMLEDEDFLAAVECLIKENQLSAERAFEFKSLELRMLWSKSESAMLQQRRADLAGMSIRVIYELLGQSTQAVLERENDGPVVVFTRELTPGLTMELARHKVAGIASSEGTKTSHAAILAQSLGIPCVMGLPAEIEELQQELTVILDGTEGTVIVEPTAQQIRDAETRAEKRHELSLQLREEAGEPAVTKDGVEIGLRGNLDLAEELDLALTQGAEGLGLVRTEFLLMGRSSLPSEDEQFAFYSKVARKFSGRPVTFRSYDLGGDKFPAPFRPPREANPFLGWRAIRVCLDEPSIFLPQLRALLRARAVGDVRLMLPLVTCVEEVDRTRELVAQCAAELKKEGVEAADGLPIGVMVETPAAVVLVEELAQRSDFLSIGTNDLTQYTLVVDRGNARLVGRFEPFHPAVIRQLSKVIDAGFDAGLEVSVCGEMASDPRAAVLLVGLGCKVLSVSPANLPLVKWVVRQIETDKAGEVARNMLSLDATGEVVEALQAVVNGFQGQGSLEMA